MIAKSALFSAIFDDAKVESVSFRTQSEQVWAFDKVPAMINVREMRYVKGPTPLLISFTDEQWCRVRQLFPETYSSSDDDESMQTCISPGNWVSGKDANEGSSCCWRWNSSSEDDESIDVW